MPRFFPRALRPERARTALYYLGDPTRIYLTSPSVRLETVPKAEYTGRIEELAFYESFFRDPGVEWCPNWDQMLAVADEESRRNGLGALDALHVAAAHLLGADEFVTTEGVHKTVHRTRLVPARAARAASGLQRHSEKVRGIVFHIELILLATAHAHAGQDNQRQSPNTDDGLSEHAPGRAARDFRMPPNYCQQNARSLVGLISSLLPIAHRGGREPELLGKTWPDSGSGFAGWSARFQPRTPPWSRVFHWPSLPETPGLARLLSLRSTFVPSSCSSSPVSLELLYAACATFFRRLSAGSS